MKKQYDEHEKNRKRMLRQVDSTKDMLFLELCKAQKMNSNHREALKSQWQQMASELDTEIKHRRRATVFQKYS